MTDRRPDETRKQWLVGWEDNDGEPVHSAASQTTAYDYARRLKQWWPKRAKSVSLARRFTSS